MTIVFSKLAQSRSILKITVVMQPCINIFELGDLPAQIISIETAEVIKVGSLMTSAVSIEITAQRSSDRGFVFIICIVQVVGNEPKNPYFSMSLSSWSFHACRGGGGAWLKGGV